MIGMVFQMGRGGVSNFKNTLNALKNGQKETVFKGIVNSLWGKQTPARAKRTAVMLAYNIDHQDAENWLVQTKQIPVNQRKYQA